ncbi:MAG: FlgD immunoglobulin-like domain containing protein, partial [bacterium]
LFATLESLALPGKSIFINWNNSDLIKKFKIDSFTVSRSANQVQEKSWIFPSNIVSLIDSSDVLTHGRIYTYTIKAIDSLGQILDEQAITDTCDSVAFIPDIDQDKTPEYFNQNSVDIFWKWIDDIGGTVITSGTEGADSLAIQLSISNDFPSLPDQTVMTDYFKADSNRSKRVQIPKLTSRRNEKLFIRINAKDKWEHNAISSKSFWWSSDFYPLKTTIYDTVPSPKVTDFRVRNNGPFNVNSDSILVYCTWTGAGVEQGTVDTNRTILWNAKLYRIRGQWNEEQVVLGEVSVQKDKENYVFEAPVLNRYFRWQVDVIDSAGNITQGDLVDTENYIETPPPPHPLDYKMCLVPEIESAYPLEYYVEIALNPTHFSLAYQNDDIRERLLCQLGWTVNDTLICTSGWGSIIVDTTWFRLKIREKRSNDLWVESAWSPVVTFPSSSSEAKSLTQIETSDNTIQSFYLYPNKPNPFNNSTTVRYDIPEPSQVYITIYNMKGSLVKQFKKSRLSSGSYYLKWDGTDMYDMQVSSGIYICYFMARTEQGKWWKNEIKMLLIK